MSFLRRILAALLYPALCMAEVHSLQRELSSRRRRVYPIVMSGGGVLSDTESREFVILRWPDGHETCAWDDEHVRRARK